MGKYCTTWGKYIAFFLCIFFLGIGVGIAAPHLRPTGKVVTLKETKAHWFVLFRKSNIELLYFGTPGKESESRLIKAFIVKAGIPKERPTPLPQLLGRAYWIITDKMESQEAETAPYFLSLNVPVGESEPFGPTPYAECNGQCNWTLPGAFGLHGVNGDTTKLALENQGSSGCIRHADQDIIYLYNLLDPKKEEIRYYIKDL